MWAAWALGGLGVGTALATDHAMEVAGGALLVESEPAGAEILLDDRTLGRTPLTLRDLDAGEHRLLLRQPGYLDNARLLKPRPGESGTLRVVLTALPAAAVGTDQTRPAALAKRKGGLRKKLLIATPVTAGAGAYFLLANRGAPPVTLTDVQPTGPLLMGVTQATLTAAADGDGLRFEWELGDGGTSSGGATVTHVFAQAGELTVKVKVFKGDAYSSATRVVNVKSLAGEWDFLVEGRGGRTLALQQNGPTFTGSVMFGDSWGYATVSGTGENPRRIRFVETFRGGGSASFDGEADATLDRISGRASTGETWEFRRR